jgi:hypothetical protein
MTAFKTKHPEQTAKPENIMETYHITHEDDRWVLREEGDQRALLEASSRQDILDETRDYMKLRTALVKVHGEDGEVAEEHRYPQEQDPLATGG